MQYKKPEYCAMIEEYYNRLQIARGKMQLTRQVQSIGYTWRVSVKFILDKGERICNIPASIASVLPQRHTNVLFAG